jgi:hypothetical protein
MNIENKREYKQYDSRQELVFPIQVKEMTVQETKEYHLKKIFEMSKVERSKLEYRTDGSIWKEGKPIAVEPTYEQMDWFNHKIKRRFV